MIKYSPQLLKHLEQKYGAHVDYGQLLDEIEAGSMGIQGVHRHYAPDGLGWITDYNLMPDEGLTYVLGAAIGNAGAISAWFIAIHAGSSLPADAWNGSNYAANATEITTGYSEATRVSYVPGAALAKNLNNSASKAVFTAAETDLVINGCGVLSDSPKGGATGTLLSSSKFSAQRTLPLIGDTLTVQIDYNATSI